jgi:hypothetical protein
MLEKANALGNAGDSGSKYAAHRKVADFQRVFNRFTKVKGTEPT